MAAKGSIKVGNAYILITPEMNQAQLKAQLEVAEKEIAAFSGTQKKLAEQTAKLQERLQVYLTKRYGEEAAERVKLEQAAAAKRSEYAKTETAAYLKAIVATTEAFAKAEQAKTVTKEKAARAQERIALNSRALEVKYGREAAASYLKSVEEMKASGKVMYLTRINEAKQWSALEIVEQRKVAAEQLKQSQVRQAQVSNLSRLVIRQAALEATEQVKAARTAQAAYTTAHTVRTTQLLAEMELQRSVGTMATQSSLAAATAAKAAAQQTIRSNNAAARTLQANASKVEKSWTKSTYTMGQKLTAVGSAVSEFGRTVQRSMVTPLLTAATAMSYFGIKAADSIMQSQTALQKMGVTSKDSTRQLDVLKTYGVQTPYSVEDMFSYGTQYTRAAMSHGYSSTKAVDRSTDLVMSIGDLAAYSGITDPEQVKRAMNAVATIQEADRASLRNVRSLAQNAGMPVQELATTLGFSDRDFTEKEIAAKKKAMEDKGVKWDTPDKYLASAQMMDWMAKAQTTGGIPGESIVDAILKKGQSMGTGTKDAPGLRQGAATISARLANMGEQAKYGLSDMFVSKTGKDGAYEYTGAGAALMDKGGLLDRVSALGGDFKEPSGKVIAELFKDLGVVADWASKFGQAVKDHPEITDAVIKIGKVAALVGVFSIAIGTLTKMLGLVTKVFSPVAGLAKGLVKAGKGSAKVASQVTGLGGTTDAEKEARGVRQRAAQQAREEKRQARREARQLSDPADRFQARRDAKEQAKQTKAAAKERAKEIRRQGREGATYRERYQQRRTNANDGDSRSLPQRAVDSARGRNSQVEEIEINTDRAKGKLSDLEDEIASLKTRLRDLKSEDLKPLAQQFAGEDSSVKSKAALAEKAAKSAETAVKNLRNLKLSALTSEFEKAKESNDSFKSAVKRAESAVSGLDRAKLGSLDGEFDDSKSKSKSLIASVKDAAKQAGKLNSAKLSDLKEQVKNVKDETEATTKKVGSGKSTLIGRVGQLNDMTTSSVVKQIKNLKEALDDAAGKAKTLNSRLNDVSNHAPGKSSGGTTKKKKALGGVLPGYTPGQDVHVFTSPTAGELHLSGGESVMRPEWTAAVGAGEVTRLNEIARTQGVGGVRQAMKFAKGGILGKLGLDQLVDAAQNFNVANDARGALATMTMDSSSRAIGGDAQSGVVGSGTDASHFIGSDFGEKFRGMYDFMTRDSWDILKKLPIPDGYSQLIGTIGGVMGPISGEYFWDDVWKGRGNILERGGRYVNDLFSAKTLKSIVSNLFGGAWDSIKSLWSGGKALLSDPAGFISDGVTGMWELAKSEYTGITDMVSSLREVWQSPMDYASQVIGDVYSTAKDQLPNLEGLFDFSGDGISSKTPDIAGIVNDQISMPAPVGDAVTRWTPQVKMALAQLGLPATDLELVLHRINVESGGNPKAINLWDSNAKAGSPSQGLMQTIPQTFAAYAGPYKSRGITDPLASIYAGLNYAVSRYGSGWRTALSGIKGYATGTDGAEKGWAWVGEAGPELVNFKGGETVLNHQDSVLASIKTLKGYASGTGSSTRTTGVAADAEKGVSSLNSAVNKLYSIIKQAFTSGRIGSGTANSLNKWLDKQNKTLQKLVADRTTLATKLKDANTALTEVKNNESDMAASISDKAMEERSLTSIFNEDGVSVTSGISGLKERLAAIKSFQSNISQLVDRGFSNDIISEIAQEGPVEGGAIAKELLNATEAQVDDYNSTYASISSASSSLGKSVAQSYYATGKAAAQALVDGLTDQDNALKKKIEGIADTIIKTLKSKLKVGSKTPVTSGLASLLTWLTGESQAVTGGGSTSTKKKTVKTTTTYSTDSQGRKVMTVTTTTTDPAKGTSTTVTKRTVGGKTTTSTKVTTTKGYATGTRSAARGLALVGERGKELVDFKGGERVYNAQETAELMGPRYEIHIHEATAEDTTQSVLRALKYAETMAAL